MVSVVVNNKANSSVTYDVNSGVVVGGGNDAYNFPDHIQEMANQAGLTSLAHTLNQESQEFDQKLRQQEQQLPSEHDITQNGDNVDSVSFEEDFENNAPNVPPDGNSARDRRKKIAKKKSRSQDRFEDMALRISTTSQERDQALLEANINKHRAEELERAYLELQTNLYQSKIDEANNIMFNARQEGDLDLEKQASDIVGELRFDQIAKKRQLDQLDQQKQTQENTPPDPRESILYEHFDTKELESPSLDPWLEANPECNPYSPEYDDDYAKEVSSVKKTLNKWLVGQKQKSIIGQDEYYEILDDALNKHFGRIATVAPLPHNQSPFPPQGPVPQNYANYGNPPQRPMAPPPPAPVSYPQPAQPQYGYPQQQAGYQPPQYAPNPYAYPVQTHPQHPQQNYRNPPPRPVNTVYVPIGTDPYSPVSRVNRDGYGNGQQSHAGLPELDPLQRHMALTMPLFTKEGAAITDPAAKIHNYKIELARMNGKG